MAITEKIRYRIFDFFVRSSDFNGIPLRNISGEFGIEYESSVDIIKQLVIDESVSVQSSTNPHIIGFRHHKIEDQITLLEEAKKTKVKEFGYGELKFISEDTEYPICLYPSKKYLSSNRDITSFNNAYYTKQLALGEPQLKPIFFDIEVLDRYFIDPRFNFNFKDYSGSISHKHDDKDQPIVRAEDQIFIETFGLGFDENKNRLAVVFLRYLMNLTEEHQIFWRSKEVMSRCKILEEYYMNTIEGNWSFSHSVFSAFLSEQKCISDLTELIFGKSIFRKTFERNKRPREFTFFFTPTLKNYNDFILLLDKMISENINKDFFVDKIELYTYKEIDKGFVEREHKGTLQLFEEWLADVYATESGSVSDLFKPLKKIRRERQNPAHRINENEYNRAFTSKQNEAINTAYSVFRNLRMIFQQHPEAAGYEIPNWLDNGRIKIF